MLMNISISTTEQNLLTNYTGDVSKQNQAVQLAIYLSRIPNWREKTIQLLERHKFDQEIISLQQDVSRVDKEIRLVFNSTHFQKILRVILGFGNFVNGGTNLGGANGFSINDLAKLKNMKSNKKDQFAIHFIALVISQQCPDAFSIYEEFSNLKDASYIDVDAIQTKLKTALFSLAHRKREPFVISSTKRIHEVLKSVDQLNELYEKINITFGINNELFKPALMLSIISDFVSDLIKAGKDLKIKRVTGPLPSNLPERDFPKIRLQREGTQRGMYDKIIGDLNSVE